MYFNTLFKKKNRRILFTTPSHSQKFNIVKKLRHFYSRDISETDTHNPIETLNNAQKKAAEIYGVNQTFFLTNGSSSGIIAGILSCVKRGENVLVNRDAHRCHHNSIKLAGANPIYYELPKIEKWGISGKTTVENIEQYLKNYKIKAVLITSPSYYGIVSDIKSLKSVCKKYGAYLITDEAHGALYPFSNNLPESAVNISDITVQSLHKTAGGLNPTALIHSNLDYDITPFIDMITTTSPSYPLLASIEANINFLNSKRGRLQIENLITQIKRMRTEVSNIEFGGDDITKILIKKDCLSGENLSNLLFDKYGIEDEITNNISTMLLTGIGTSTKKITKLKEILKKL